jgi:hypothetical protein
MRTIKVKVYNTDPFDSANPKCKFHDLSVNGKTRRIPMEMEIVISEAELSALESAIPTLWDLQPDPANPEAPKKMRPQKTPRVSVARLSDFMGTPDPVSAPPDEADEDDDEEKEVKPVKKRKTA